MEGIPPLGESCGHKEGLCILTAEGLDVHLVPTIGGPKVEGLVRVKPDHRKLRFPESLVPSMTTFGRSLTLAFDVDLEIGTEKFLDLMRAGSLVGMSCVLY